MSIFQRRLPHVARWIDSIGWPVFAGMIFAISGIVCLGVSQNFDLQRRNLEDAAALEIKPKASAIRQLRALPVVFPSAREHTADLAQIFDLAKDQGIILVSGEYRDADPTSYPVDVRIVELRFSGDYSKSKEFLGGLLNSMPHLAVLDLRMERKDSITTQQQVFLRLALMYGKHNQLDPKADLNRAATLEKLR